MSSADAMTIKDRRPWICMASTTPPRRDRFGRSCVIPAPGHSELTEPMGKANDEGRGDGRASWGPPREAGMAAVMLPDAPAPRWRRDFCTAHPTANQIRAPSPESRPRPPRLPLRRSIRSSPAAEFPEVGLPVPRIPWSDADSGGPLQRLIIRRSRVRLLPRPTQLSTTEPPSPRVT